MAQLCIHHCKGTLCASLQFYKIYTTMYDIKIHGTHFSFTLSSGRTHLFYWNNPNIKAFPLNLGTIQKNITGKVEAFLFSPANSCHLMCCHVISCHAYGVSLVCLGMVSYIHVNGAHLCLVSQL